MAEHIGDFERTQLVTFFFVSRQGNGVLTSQMQKVGGGTPTFKVKRHSDRTEKPVTSITLNDGGDAGQHFASIDTNTDQAFYVKDSYDFLADDVEVFDGTAFQNVSGETVKNFSLVNRTAGFVLTRSHKIFDGTVTAVTDAKTFRITGLGLNITDVDHYVGQQLVFQRISSNAGLSRVIDDSRVIDTSNVEVVLQKPFPSAPMVGDPFDLLHGLPESVFTANIVMTPGTGGLTDAVSVRWQRDREKIDLADLQANLPTSSLEVWRLFRTTPPQVLQSTLIETLTAPVDASGAYLYALTNHSTAKDEGLFMKAESVWLPSNRTINDSRIMFVT